MASKCCSADEIPNAQHYTIIVFSRRTIHHEGDERSRNYPGHGYPAYDETLLDQEYHCYLNKANWIEAAQSFEIRRMNGGNFTFACLEINKKAKVNYKVDIDLE